MMIEMLTKIVPDKSFKATTIITAIKLNGRKVSEYDSEKGLTDLNPLKEFVGHEIMVYKKNGKEFSHRAKIDSIETTDEGDIINLGPLVSSAIAAKDYQGPKVNRNEFCPCGSGKKYKKCCGT